MCKSWKVRNVDKRRKFNRENLGNKETKRGKLRKWPEAEKEDKKVGLEGF